MENKIQTYLSVIKDPRVVGRCHHKLQDILLVALLTYLSGGEDYQDMHTFAQERFREFSDVLELPGGAPSADTFERVFKRIDPDELEQCLICFGKDILNTLTEKQIAIDGKKLRGATPTRKDNQGLYLLNAWVCENGFVLAQDRIGDKENEIKAIPAMLDRLDLTGAVVSIDAIGTQKEIARKIRKKGGHYLLAVKENQRELHRDIEDAFRLGHPAGEHTQTEKDHGRVETRKCSILPAMEYLMDENFKAWKDIATLVRVETEIFSDGKTASTTRYYISNEGEERAVYFQMLVRGHWGIENQLHWHLDVTFKEDRCRTRYGFAPQNLSAIRKIALQMLKSVNDRRSLKKRQYAAALNPAFLRKVIEAYKF